MFFNLNFIVGKLILKRFYFKVCVKRERREEEEGGGRREGREELSCNFF